MCAFQSHSKNPIWNHMLSFCSIPHMHAVLNGLLHQSVDTRVRPLKLEHLICKILDTRKSRPAVIVSGFGSSDMAVDGVTFLHLMGGGKRKGFNTCLRYLMLTYR